MSDATNPSAGVEGQAGASGLDPHQARIAAIALIVYGLLVLLATGAGMRGEASPVTAPTWSVVHLVVVLALAAGLLRGQAWARWGGIVISAVALFLLLPIIGALIGGPGITRLFPGLDLALMSSQAALLVFLIIFLVRMRGRAP